MKKLLLASTITALTLTLSLSATQAHASGGIAQSLCEYVAADDKKRMRSFLKSNKIKIRSVFKGIKCNGQNLLEFASTAGSVQTGSLMISKLPKKVVSDNLSLIQSSTALYDAANKRVSS